MEVENKSEDTPLIKSVYTDVMQSTINKDIKSLAKTLKKAMATDIKNWRCTNEYSWRYLAGEFVKKYQEFSNANNILSGNQVCGLILSEAAMIKLKETWE